MDYVVSLQNVTLKDVNLVGGKNASLGEMIKHLTSSGVRVPDGFATTTEVFKTFLKANHLDQKIYQALASLPKNNTAALKKISKAIQHWIMAAGFPTEIITAISNAYQLLSDNKKISVAIRSSANTEDMPDVSFAGQHDTYLNISGLKQVLLAIKKVFASLFTERSISYRNHNKIDHQKVEISAGLQRMVRSDKACSGVIFTVDTETGFDKIILISAAYGLGEAIVQGIVNTDEYNVYKPGLINKKSSVILRRKLGDKKQKYVFASHQNPAQNTKLQNVAEKDQNQFCLVDKEITELAQYAIKIEKHYGMPMDIEWAKDGINGKLYIVQARPVTVKNQQINSQRYKLQEKGTIKISGQSIGQKIGQGTAQIVMNPKKMGVIKKGEVLVTDMTDPDWEPIMKLASGIVTNRGGRTCHAAIVARELGIPAIVGCNNATTAIKRNEKITVSCAEGETGHVYGGYVKYKIETISPHIMPTISTRMYLNLGNPDKAFMYQSIPNEGVGLARLEFIISNTIGIHPNAVLKYKSLPKKLQNIIANKTSAYTSPVEYYIEKMREGIATIAAAFFPKQVIFRFSDFKSNEYANLLGGELFEPIEENPMLGYRGASRYVDEQFRACFELECMAFKRVREEMGLTNTQVMIPFVRTINELKNVIYLMEKFGLKRGKNDLKVFMMCEIPANVILAEEFLEYVDGFSIGSNDLTQLTLGLDRDSALISAIFDERNDAVKILLKQVIQTCNKAGKYVGICGQAPSDYPELAAWLMQQGIHSLSLSPDSIVDTWLMLGQK